MPSYRPYKFLVMPIVQTLDDEGAVVGEIQKEQPDVVFGIEALVLYAEGFEATLAAQQNGGVSHARD